MEEDKTVEYNEEEYDADALLRHDRLMHSPMWKYAFKTCYMCGVKMNRNCTCMDCSNRDEYFAHRLYRLVAKLVGHVFGCETSLVKQLEKREGVTHLNFWSELLAFLDTCCPSCLTVTDGSGNWCSLCQRADAPFISSKLVIVEMKRLIRERNSHISLAKARARAEKK